MIQVSTSEIFSCNSFNSSSSFRFLTLKKFVFHQAQDWSEPQVINLLVFEQNLLAQAVALFGVILESSAIFFLFIYNCLKRPYLS